MPVMRAVIAVFPCLCWRRSACLQRGHRRCGTAPRATTPRHVAARSATVAEPATPPRQRSAAPAGFGPSVGFRSSARLDEHFAKHGSEFGTISRAEYLRQAQALRDAPVSATILEVRRPDGVVSRFDREQRGLPRLRCRWHHPHLLPTQRWRGLFSATGPSETESMTEPDPVRRMLADRGCPEEVVRGGWTGCSSAGMRS